MQASVIKPTSNEVKREGLDDVRRSGRAAIQQGLVLSALMSLGPMTRHQLAEHHDLALSSVCGRCTELLDLKLIDVAGTTGKPARQLLTITDKGRSCVAFWAATCVAKNQAEEGITQ